MLSLVGNPVRHRQPGEMACGGSPDCPRGRRVRAPAGQVLVHDVVGGRQLQSAIRLLATSRTLACCSAARGALLLIVGPTWGIFINVLIYLPLTLWLIRNPKEVNTNPNPTSAAMTSFRDMFDTVRQVSGIPVVFAMSFLAGLAAFFIGNAHEPQMPEFARDLGYGGEGLYYSMLLTANAVGALMAGIILEAGNMLPAKTRTSFILGLLWALAILGFAVSQTSSRILLLLCQPGPVVQSDDPYAGAAPFTARNPGPRDRYSTSAASAAVRSAVTVGFGRMIGIHWSWVRAGPFACMAARSFGAARGDGEGIGDTRMTREKTETQAPGDAGSANRRRPRPERARLRSLRRIHTRTFPAGICRPKTQIPALTALCFRGPRKRRNAWSAPRSTPGSNHVPLSRSLSSRRFIAACRERKRRSRPRTAFRRPRFHCPATRKTRVRWHRWMRRRRTAKLHGPRQAGGYASLDNPVTAALSGRHPARIRSARVRPPRSSPTGTRYRGLYLCRPA